MSRAFINEDRLVAELPDRPISPHPNLVTERGLALIDKELDAARRAHGEAQATGDRDSLAKAGRELRYWSARRASAQVQAGDPASVSVQFGSTVTIVRDDERVQTYRIVGEDEADPAQGSISYISPLAQALMGKVIGDAVTAGQHEAEITRIE
jgi:transcription elongation GreA/GreB family factor